MSPAAHVAAEALARVAAGAAPDAPVAEHLARCPECRAALAERDPSALFALLAVLPQARPVAPYRRPALSARTSAPGAHGRARLTAAAAAVLLLVVVVVSALRGPAPVDEGAAGASAREAAPVAVAAVEGAGPLPVQDIVARVDSPTARVVTLVPPGSGAGRPTVTLILDEELDL